MKKRICYLCLMGICCLLFITSCSKEQGNVVTVYLPDSYSWLEKSGVCKSFKEKNECNLRFVYFEASVNIISRLSLEISNPKADVLMGLSRSTFIKAKAMDLLQQYKPENAAKIIGKNEISPDYYATMFDYGGLAIIYNEQKLNKKLKTLEDLIKLKRELVIPDPRTSTTGQDFLLWTIAEYQEKWQEFWWKLKPSILTVTKGWSSAFSKLETGEADAMVSYASDKAYNIYKYQTSKFEVFVPESGGFRQIEGNALVKKNKIKSASKAFIDFMLSDEVQSMIFLNNWMMPVTNVELPEIAEYYVKADKDLTMPNDVIEKNLTKWLQEWSNIVTE